MGETLTAATSGITDEDGLDGVAYSYQWLADGTDIAGATASTYTLAEADKGKAVRARVTFTDDAGNDESLTSDATDAVAAKPNTPATGAPAITGTAQVADLYWTTTYPISTTFSYQWLAVGSDISKATSSTYTLTFAEADKAISVTVSFTDDAGNAESLTSAATDALSATAQLQEAEPTDRPHKLTARDSDGTVVLAWAAPVVDYYVSSYHILRHRPELGEAEPLVLVNQTANNDATYTDADVEPGVLYVYSVRAIVNWMGDLGDRGPRSNGLASSQAVLDTDGPQDGEGEGA